MSMFHELMMRKKEEIMYATIKGSLTENDGVFSGFSASNYLITQNAFPLQPAKFEIFVKIKNTATDNNERYFVAGQYRTSFIIGITKVSANTFTFKLYGGNADGTGAGWNKTSEQITIDETQFFGVKFSYDGSEYALYVNGIKIISYLSTTRLYGNAPIYLGKWNSGSNTNVFVGEMDINNSYIKLGSTKYNLQAVVGYTIVGSPTIVDGVVSGFSYGDYINISQFVSNANIVEFVTKVKFNSFLNWQGLISSVVEQNGFLLRVHSSGYVSFSPYFRYGNENFILVSNTALSTGIYYWIKIIKKGSQYQMLLSTDGSAFYEVASATSSLEIQGNFVKYGVAGIYPNVAIDGSIDLNETYIKINNKLWFNGQQA